LDQLSELPAEIRDVLNRFAEAWGSADPARVLAVMAEDCVYEASVGPEPGRTYRGAAELLVGLKAMFAHDAPARIEITDVFGCGDRAAWEWRYYDAADNLIARGCDLFLLRDGRIAVKNAFRKTTA
jgi:ketosteroid isomerase-like protein